METLIGALRYVLPILSVLVITTCIISLIKTRPRIYKMAQLVNPLDNSTIDLSHWETSIGRSKSCDIVLNYGTVSRFHGVLSKRRKGWIVSDTFSKGGIYVNDEKIRSSTEIYDGDIILFGNVAMVFRCDEAIDKKSKEQLRSSVAKSDVAVLVNVKTRKQYTLSEKTNQIGRNDDASIHLSDPSVSKKHAKIYMTSKGWAIQDVGSSNGTLLNGEMITQPLLLYDEDRLTFGNVTLIYYENK